jgi:hypothetical protein
VCFLLLSLLYFWGERVFLYLEGLEGVRTGKGCDLRTFKKIYKISCFFRFFPSHFKYLSSCSFLFFNKDFFLFFNKDFFSLIRTLANGSALFILQERGKLLLLYFFASYLFCLKVLGLFIFFERDRTIRDSISTKFSHNVGLLSLFLF